MDKDEQQLLDYTLKAKGETPPPPPPPDAKKSDSEIVEKKARQGKPVPATVLQKRSLLSENQLENRIAETIRKHPNVDEIILRARVAGHLEAKNGDISEAEYAKIADEQIAKDEKQQEQEQKPGGPLVSPPTIVSTGVQGVQDKAAAAADRASSLATPGGIGFLIFVLLFFIWVIVPVSETGQTRMQLLWGVITGQAHFKQEYQDIENNPEAHTPTGGNIGGGELVPYRPTMNLNLTPSFED